MRPILLRKVLGDLCRIALGFFILSTIPTGNAQDVDFSAQYKWDNVHIRAGGWMRGMAISPTDPTRRYARGDVDNTPMQSA